LIDLKAKRAEIAQRHQNLQEFNDYWAARAKDGDKIAERPVAFICDDEIVAIGDDVAAIFAGLAKFVAEKGAEFDAAAGEPAKLMAIAKAKKALASPPPAEIRVSAQVWNSYLWALAEVGIQVATSDGSK
jgi:hypothetical protein